MIGHDIDIVVLMLHFSLQLCPHLFVLFLDLKMLIYIAFVSDDWLWH